MKQICLDNKDMMIHPRDLIVSGAAGRMEDVWKQLAAPLSQKQEVNV